MVVRGRRRAARERLQPLRQPLSAAEPEQVEHRDPLEMLDELKAIEAEILEEMDALGDQLREVGA